MSVRAFKTCGLAALLLAAMSAAAQYGQGNYDQQVRITQGPVIQYADDAFAVITWNSDVASASRVYYGTSQTDLTQVAEAPGTTTTHRVHLSGLKPSTTYYFQVDTGPTPGATASFRTVAGGAPPLRDFRPTITTQAAQSVTITNGPAIQYADDRSAVITWSTNVPAESTLYYGTDANNLTQTAEDPATTTFHRVHLANLAPNATYYFQVANAEGAAARVSSFRTVAGGAAPLYDQRPSATAPTAGTPVLGTREQPRATSTRGTQVPAGTEINAILLNALSTKTSRVGDEFTATVSQQVRADNGGVAIPAGAKIRGEVTEVEQGKTLPALRGKARLNLRFKDLILPDGSTVPITATLVNVNHGEGKSTGAKTTEEGEVHDRTTGKEVAKDVGIGAGIGTVAGLIFGSALKGLAIGAIAGGGYVLATQGKDVQLPAETGMLVRLDHAISVPARSVSR